MSAASWLQITALALMASSRAEASPVPAVTERYGDLVSLHKPVVIYPTEATCTMGNITLDRNRNFSRNYAGPDVTYHCLPRCSRLYPIQHDTLVQAVAAAEVLYLGGPSCVESGAQPADDESLRNCSAVIDSRPAGDVHTFILDVYVEEDGVILTVAGAFLLRARNGLVYLEAERLGHGMGIVMDAWIRLGIQLNRSVVDPVIEMSLYVGTAQTSQRQDYPLPNGVVNSGVVLGAASSASDPGFQGKVRNVKIYSELLTNREITAILNYIELPELSPKSDCVCPESFPWALDASNDLDLYCARNARPEDERVPRHAHGENERLFMPQYLTDGVLENYELYQDPMDYFVPEGFRMWASTPGQDNFYITLLLEVSTVVSRVELHMPLMPATDVAFYLQSAGDNSWDDIRYFVSNDNLCPANDRCTLIEGTTLEWEDPEFDIGRPFSSVITNKLQFNVKGYSMTENDFFVFTEIVVYGKEPCDCYGPGTQGCDIQGRVCICIAELDMNYASPRCEPYVSSVTPTYGPDSGGTTITLHGALLSTAAPPSVDLLQHGECNVVDSSTSSAVTCKTPERSNDELDSVIVVSIGPVNIFTNITFSYRPDPSITGITPASSILVGGIVQTVTGVNLQSVFAPEMLTYIRYPTIGSLETQVRSSPCTVLSDTVMLCSTPEIPAAAQIRYLWDAPPNTGEPIARSVLDIDVGFLLDGLGDYIFHAPIDIHYNPEFDDFTETDRIREFRTYSPHNQRRIEVTGQRLQTCCLDSDFHITVGGEICEIDSRDARTIYCYPPLEEPSSVGSIFNIPQVKVVVGSFTKTVGYLDYESSLVESEEFITGLAVSLVLLLTLCLVIILAYRYVVYYRKKQLDLDRRKSFEHLNELKRKDTMLLNLLPDKLQNRLQGCMVDIDELEMSTELGKGNFGVVYQGTLKRDGQTLEVAVKTIKKLDIGFSDIEEFLQEATITRGFDHPHVLAIIGVAIDRRECYVILPFMEKGNLRDVLLVVTNRYNLGDLAGLGLQAAKGMAYLESQKFLHRDLAARNCMVDGNSVVKIADFGLSRDLYQGNYYQSSKSRPLPVKWMALECLVNNAVFSTKSDVWSFGVLLWEIITRGVVPYSHIDPRHQLHHLRQGGRLGKPEYCPEVLYNVMLSCWAVKPKGRPSFKELVEKITYIIEPGNDDEDDGENNALHRNRPSREDMSRSTANPGREPSIHDTSTNPTDDTHTEDDISASVPDEPSPSETMNRKEPASDAAPPTGHQTDESTEMETSCSKPYERLSCVPVPEDNEGAGPSGDEPYTRLSTVPSYLEVIEAPPEPPEETDIDDVLPVVKESSDEVIYDDATGFEDPSDDEIHVSAPESNGFSNPKMPDYLVIVESPISSDADYMNISYPEAQEQPPKKKGLFSRKPKDDVALYMEKRMSKC